jgi:hypothetical protein
MRNFYSPTQDASLYEQFPTRNTGRDEILEVGKTNGGRHIVRSLLTFPTPVELPSTEYDLVLRVANATNLNQNQQLIVSAISSSWIEGDGYFYQDVFQIPNGVNWNSATQLFTSSLASSSINLDITNEVRDVVVNITPLVQASISASIPNIQLGISLTTTDEQNLAIQSNLKFFSRNSHTIHVPKLVAKWDNQLYLTGSMSASTVDVIVSPRTLKSKYRVGETARVELSVRERYPRKSFNTVYTTFNGTQRLPITSYYSIIDQQSNSVIIPFDEYSKISCDGVTSYFNFNIQSMYAGRYYKMLIKVIGVDYTQIIDNGYIFSIENL